MTTPPTPPKPPKPTDLLNEKLAQELITMRDALMKLSLCLNDWRFEMDQQARQLAQQETDAVLHSAQHKPVRSQDANKS